MITIFKVCGALVICLGSLNMGAMFGFPTIALPKWKHETDIKVNLDANEGSLFVSLYWILGIIFSPIGGILSGWLGRRKMVVIAAPLAVCGWLIIAMAKNKIMIYIGGIITSSKKKIDACNVYKLFA